MVAFRLTLVLSTLAAASAHTRGAAQLEDEQPILASHRELTRRLMKDKKQKNLATNPGGFNNGSDDNTNLEVSW